MACRRRCSRCVPHPSAAAAPRRIVASGSLGKRRGVGVAGAGTNALQHTCGTARSTHSAHLGAGHNHVGVDVDEVGDEARVVGLRVGADDVVDAVAAGRRELRAHLVQVQPPELLVRRVDERDLVGAEDEVRVVRRALLEPARSCDGGHKPDVHSAPPRPRRGGGAHLAEYFRFQNRRAHGNRSPGPPDTAGLIVGGATHCSAQGRLWHAGTGVRQGDCCTGSSWDESAAMGGCDQL